MVLSILQRKSLVKNFMAFLSDLMVIKFQAAEFSKSDIIAADVQNISTLIFFFHFSVSFIEKKPPIKFYGVLDNFPRTYEVAKF